MLIMEPDGRLDLYPRPRYSLLDACWAKLACLLQGRSQVQQPRRYTKTAPVTARMQEAA